MSQTSPNITTDHEIFQRVDAERFPLIDRFYRAQGYKVKCAANERVYAIVHKDEGFIASVRLVPQSSGHYWLRNLLVASDKRGQGLATALMRYLLADVAQQGCYCFALRHLDNFYSALGFTLNPDHCPEDILATYNIYRARGRDWLLMGYRQG